MCHDHMEATVENAMSTGKYNQLEIHKPDDAILPNTLNNIFDAANKPKNNIFVVLTKQALKFCA